MLILSALKATIVGVSAFSIIAAASGCERSHGMARTAKLPDYPPPACVVRAMGQIGAIERFDEHHEPQGQGADVQRFQNVSYHGMGIDVELGVFEESDHTRLIQSHMYVHEPPTQRDIETARTLMKAVEENLEEFCEISGLRELVREKCVGAKCD